MKDGLGKVAINRMSTSLGQACPGFPVAQFRRLAIKGLDQLELKERVTHLIEVLHRYMPENFHQTAKVLMAVTKHWDRGDPNDPLSGFAAWPLIDYASVYGLDYPEPSLKVLKQLTPLFSAEFAIRAFIINHNELTYEHLLEWATHKSEHVRRLVSEGTRPRLPWGQRLPGYIKDPTPVIKLLEILKDDTSEMVRRSVANNLNDISKDHPERVISLCENWQTGASNDRQWIIRHACRSLIKAGHPDVFPLLGYTKNPKVDIAQFSLDKKRIKLGESLRFGFKLRSKTSTTQRVVVDYAIHHVKANKELTAKVFKLKEIELEKGGSIKIEKAHGFREITTRKYYPGRHLVEIIINGVSHGKKEFSLSIK